jgi:hypothetical protein
MANLSYPEIVEITTAGLPPASLDALKTLRNQQCETANKSGFKLQSQQRFLRRVLSPDAPARNLLLVHGTGSGKTCTAIQVAEEYILRPEFQDKKVFLVASAAVQNNFHKELFELNRVTIDTVAGTLESKQCTGRRYLDMLLRIESEPKNWNNPTIRAKLQDTANKIIDEFYEFMAYTSFGNLIITKLLETKIVGKEKEKKSVQKTPEEKIADIAWVHDNFDNRLVIIDEAHNIREGGDSNTSKAISDAMERLVKIADGMVLVFLTATPMYDNYEEIIFYMNIFLWNDRKQANDKKITVESIFNKDATLIPGEAEQQFRDWCQSYVSYVKGENPFTFPFRLSPPRTINTALITKSYLNEDLAPADALKYLQTSLVESIAAGEQLASLIKPPKKEDSDESVRKTLMEVTVAVLPGGKSFDKVFKTKKGESSEYIDKTMPFLSTENLPNYSTKFVSVIKSIEEGSGIVLVYSNYVTMGARLFAMALEEHGYLPQMPKNKNGLLTNRTYTGAIKGRYILLTAESTASDIAKMVSDIKSPDNRDGSKIRIVIAGPIASEGVDFRYVRQVHVLDPWWNMSRIEQVIGRGLRTCSHQLLPRFEDQNCTVYLHVIRRNDGTECYDEYTYRSKVEQKAMMIARVRKVIAESAMDCPLQNSINTLPEEWRNLIVPQQRSEGTEPDSFRLYGMLAPAFMDAPFVEACNVSPPKDEPDHVRPLSTYLDVQDELLTKLAELFQAKPIWDRTQLIRALQPFTKDVVIFNLRQAISSAFRFKDSFGRPSVLESKGGIYALAPLGVSNSTMIERISRPAVQGSVSLSSAKKKEDPVVEEAVPAPVVVEEAVPAPVVVEEAVPAPVVEEGILERKKAKMIANKVFPPQALERFSSEVINGFVFDHGFSKEEKREYLRTRPKDLPFADRLYINDKYIILGDNKFDPPEKPLGEDDAAFKEWNSRLLKRFIDAKDIPFASMKEKDVVFSKLTEEGGRYKNYFLPIRKSTGTNKVPILDSLSKTIDSRGVGVPLKPNNNVLLVGESRFVYIELLAREEHNCLWLTPEELDVLGETENHKILRDKFKK